MKRGCGATATLEQQVVWNIHISNNCRVKIAVDMHIHVYTLASVPGLPRYVRVLICGGGDNAVKTGKAWAD